jgi:hypothetical protein
MIRALVGQAGTRRNTLALSHALKANESDEGRTATKWAPKHNTLLRALGSRLAHSALSRAFGSNWGPSRVTARARALLGALDRWEAEAGWDEGG